MPENISAKTITASLEYYLTTLAESGLEGIPTSLAGTSPSQTPPADTARITTQKIDPDEQPQRHLSLETIKKGLINCRACGLSREQKETFFGNGNPNARIVFIGESHAGGTDSIGGPFDGKEGEMLSRIIKAMGLKREELYFCSVIKCRPAGSSGAGSDQLSACLPFLKQQLHSIKPDVIISLGQIPTQTLLASKEPFARLRGRFHDFEGMPLMTTCHPAYLLRQENAGDKSAFWDVWKDMTQVLQLLKLPVPSKGRKPVANDSPQ